MYISTSLITLVVAASNTQAFQLADVKTAASAVTRSVSDAANSLLGQNQACPPVWSEISTALTAQFLGDGQCTDAARAAIRSAFHDCFNGGRSSTV